MGLKYSIKSNGNKRRRRIQYIAKRKSCPEEIFESITGCKHPLIALGATTIGSADRAPDEINTRIMELR
jgi:hypothetical protein